MNKKIIINEVEYEIIKEYNNGFELEPVTEKMTEYFLPYDYIVGDWAYGKVRLKGFYDPKNSNVRDINNYNKIEEYLKNNCAFNCKYFVLKKIANN